MLYGKYPFNGLNDHDILKKIKNTRPDFSKVNISEKAIDFINKCLQVDPRKRISWVEIYSHPLLEKKNDNFIYGTLKSKISLGENKNFYEKNNLPKSPYPEIGDYSNCFK
jgi:serine/threonine protein kinase